MCHLPQEIRSIEQPPKLSCLPQPPAGTSALPRM
jgi:hypothetical protein